jgi:signal transduction histidine kinase
VSSPAELRVLRVAGAAGVTIALGSAPFLFERLPYAAMWTLPFVAAYVSGLWACRAEPDNDAAVRLLRFGVVSTLWVGLSEVLLLWVYGHGLAPALVPISVLMQVLGLLMATSMCAALVRYPDGRPRLLAEALLVRVLAALSVLVPALLLLSRREVVPPWILQWAEESGGLDLDMPSSPLFLSGLDWVGPAPEFFHDSALGLMPTAAVLVAAARFRRLDRAQRARMAWPLQAALVLILMAFVNYLVLGETLPDIALNVLDAACMVLLPVSLGIGIVRPELFDVLGTVRRTVGFTVLSLTIVLLYVAAAGVMGAAVGRDNLQVAVVVAVFAALAMEPLRRRLLRGAGRLAFGEQISRDELLVRLGATLEHTVDRDELKESIAATAYEGLGVEWVRLAVHGEEPVHVGRAPAPGEHPAAEARMVHGRDDVGSIACGPVLRGRVDAGMRSLLDTLAHQSALALTNARLAERLVTAEETARRRLERDLHDGAQQDLAALLTRIGLARSQLQRGDPALVSDTLDTMHGDAQVALENLRELASGIHATVLSDQGLVEAIENRVARLPLQVSVHAGPGIREERFAPSVEGAAYFTVCEALANTLKHGAADHAVVSIRHEAGALRLEVSDDGSGFDAGARNGAGGLAGLEDRLSALGGSLEVRSRPGEGTTLLATVPAVT